MADLNSAAGTYAGASHASLVEGMCTKARQLDAVLTMMTCSGAMEMLGDEGRVDLHWLLSDLAAEAAAMARQVEAEGVH